jgi:diadenosine tetraphosphate (Ap4A) HIT family hydrolase
MPSVSLACYTCDPFASPKIRSYIFEDGTFGRLHFDLRDRDFFIYTPYRHVEHLTDMDPQKAHAVLREIDLMIGAMTDSFNVQYNKGRWKSHQHVHMTVTIDEPTFRRIKRQHLSARDWRVPSSPCGVEHRANPLSERRSWRESVK